MSPRAHTVLVATLVALLTWWMLSPAPAKVWAQLESPMIEQKLRHDFLHDALQHRDPTRPELIPGSCCGEADAYESDDFERDGENVIAILTCNQEDACTEHCMMLDDGEGGGNWVCRPKQAPGSRIIVGPNFIGSAPLNKTGHGWIFLNGAGQPYCYFFPPGA